MYFLVFYVCFLLLLLEPLVGLAIRANLLQGGINKPLGLSDVLRCWDTVRILQEPMVGGLSKARAIYKNINFRYKYISRNLIPDIDLRP